MVKVARLEDKNDGNQDEKRTFHTEAAAWELGDYVYLPPAMDPLGSFGSFVLFLYRIEKR